TADRPGLAIDPALADLRRRGRRRPARALAASDASVVKDHPAPQVQPPIGSGLLSVSCTIRSPLPPSQVRLVHSARLLSPSRPTTPRSRITSAPFFERSISTRLASSPPGAMNRPLNR